MVLYSHSVLGRKYYSFSGRFDSIGNQFTVDSNTASSFSRIKAWFSEIRSISPTLGYQPKPDKIFLVAYVVNVDIAMALFLEEGFKINNGLHYPGVL